MGPRALVVAPTKAGTPPASRAWSKGTPWLFSDEFEWTQLSRAIAQTGHAARRGEATSAKSIYSYLIAPAWRISDTQSAYDTVKYIGVLLMTSVTFPAYALARMLVSRGAALFVAAGAAVIPALIYSSFIITEPLATPGELGRVKRFFKFCRIDPDRVHAQGR